MNEIEFSVATCGMFELYYEMQALRACVANSFAIFGITTRFDDFLIRFLAVWSID